MYLIQHTLTKYFFDGQTWNKSISYAKAYNKENALSLAVSLPLFSSPITFLNVFTKQVAILHWQFMNTIPKGMTLKNGKLFINGTNVAVTFAMIEQQKTEARQDCRNNKKFNSAISRLYVLQAIGFVNLSPNTRQQWKRAISQLYNNATLKWIALRN